MFQNLRFETNGTPYSIVRGDHAAVRLYLSWAVAPYIKTHGSESRGQEEAGRTRRMSELFTRSTALKFENAVTKPPRQLSPSYSGLNTF